MRPYCDSRFRAIRRQTREVKVGSIGIGGHNPIRVQSMTTSLTQDVDATVRQCIRLAEAGCEIIRITAPNKAAAEALKDIRARFSEAGFSDTPLVADIHFLPSAAMVAVEYVEKIRVNPGNYADKKKFAVKEYSDSEYDSELQRLHEAFTPLVKRAKALGRCLRIGTNHGSLSDRIMNRYGDTPLGMVESALEFIRIAEDNDFHDIVLSMKASNTKVMVAAYRLVVARMIEENMHYPLHLGVTEAGDGEDARIKSSIGIGALLYDGLGDTIRVSLTEDPWFEIPVAEDLARRAEAHWERSQNLPLLSPEPQEQLSPYDYQRREIVEISLGSGAPLGPLEPPRVITRFDSSSLNDCDKLVESLRAANRKLKDARLEGLLITLKDPSTLGKLSTLLPQLSAEIKALFLDIPSSIEPSQISQQLSSGSEAEPRLVFCPQNALADINGWSHLAQQHHALLALDLTAADVYAHADTLRALNPTSLIITCTRSTTGVHASDTHPSGAYRALTAALREQQIKAPIWLRVTHDFSIQPIEGFGRALLEASIFTGNLFIDGIGDLISVETVEDPVQATNLAYNILQGARMRTVKTEYVACPSCGRTLFDLQEVTARIKARTGHLKGVTIAVMGCIVNGPGEMADADFGYVGGAPSKVNLYVGKECVQYNIDEKEALDHLVALIKSHGKWVEPTPEPAIA